jgi:hypothetical protein
MPDAGRGKKAGLDSSQPLSDLEQKRGGQAFF